MSPPNEEDDRSVAGWNEYRRLVLAQLQTLEKQVSSVRDSTVRSINELRSHIDSGHGEMREYMDGNNRATNKDIGELRERIAKIEGKATAYGFMAGLVVSLIVGGLQFLPRPHNPTPITKSALEAPYGYTLVSYPLPACVLHEHKHSTAKLRREAYQRGSSKVRFVGTSSPMGEGYAR